jgi:F-type H+-transporting ATPase subunit delta
MSSYRLSSRYAKALIQLAQEKGQLEEASKDILSVDAAFENSAELRVLFRSPIIPTDKKLANSSKAV